MSPARLPFIDWMKAIGMGLIVFGHVVGGPLNLMTPPIYQKQLGVAFFLFVTGFTLARETRPVPRVVVNRLFEILVIGLAFALIVSAASFATGGRGQLSNYTPFVLGANVLVNNFPANPTTWYIGTYTHVILLWALVVRRLTVTPGLLVGAVLVEIVVRTLLWSTAGTFVAYMALPNWLTVWLLGLYAGRTAGTTEPPAWATWAAAAAVAAPLVCGAIWPFDDGFPFRALPAAGAWSRAVPSIGVSCFYIGATWLAYRWTSRLARSGVVEFLAAQTVVVFVVHMPVYLWLYPHVAAWSFWPRALLMMAVNWIGLSFVGAALYHLLPPAVLRDRVARLIA